MKPELTESDWNVYERIEALDHSPVAAPKPRKARPVKKDVAVVWDSSRGRYIKAGA